MAKELIISANVHEKKVAILEDGLVTEFYVERRDENQGVVGNLYKGRVMKVLPGMQSAFVDIGLERDAFLYVSDFTEFMEEEEEIDFREAVEDRPAVVPRTEERTRPDDRARRADRPRHESLAHSRLAPGPAREEEAAESEEAGESNVLIEDIEDIVEQLAEIADESVIPPPMTEEEISHQPATLPETEPAHVEEFYVERITDEPFQPIEAAPEAAPLTEEEVPALEETDEAQAVEPAKEEKPRSRSRRKAAGTDTEKADSKSRKRPSKDEEKQAKSGARKPASKTAAKKASRRRSSEDEQEAPPTEASRPEAPLTAEEEFQRVTDEDIALDAGDLLKDAILQEKFSEQVHRAEYSTSSVEAEPEPEWRVGSYRSQADGSSDFQRVVDETAESSTTSDMDSSASFKSQPEAEYDEDAITPFRHISDALPAGLIDRIESESPSKAGETSEIGEISGITGSDEDRSGDQSKTREAGSDLEDRDAEVRDNGTRAEFAIRRGGRGRRRRQHQKDAPPAVAGDEDAAAAASVTSVSEEEIAPAEAQASEDPARVVDTRQSETRQSDTRQSETRPGGSRHESARYDRRPDTRRPEPQRRPEQQRRPEPQMNRRPERTLPPTISELLHEGQEILVQIAKEPIAKKGARITSHIALPGRLLVYMPTVNHVGVSRKIPNDVERVRLKRIVSSLREREAATGGFIARTACAGHSEQELHDDMKYLIRTWSDVRKKAERSKAPVMVHQDLDLVQRILRDQLSEDFTAIRIDNEVEYARIVEFVNRVQPRLVKRVKLYTGSQPIFEKYTVQTEIDKAVRPRVWLKSGGYIVINQTEALVAIDVNTGKFVGKSDKLEDTITRTNLEAVKEIVRQIRLRDLGGIIVLDLIDMEERKNRQRVMAALQQELQSDRAPSKILSINDFGLVAITRKRVKQSLERTLCAPCPYCQGAGMVKSAQTMCFEILEQAKAISKQTGGSSDVMLRVSPNVAEAFRSTERAVMEEIEAYFGTPVTLEADLNLHQEQFDFAVM